MDQFFHSLFLWPIQAGIGGLYLLIEQLVRHHVGVAIVLLSLVVNLLVLPLYLIADRWQAEEHNLRERLASKQAQIRKTFRGDERHMLEATLRRQHGYSAWHVLRAAAGLLIQIPFFLGAFEVLSNTPGLRVPVGPIQDLSQPDRLLTLGALTINLMPLVMTAINLVSAAVYARSWKWRDLQQQVILAGLFLVLLYASPAGLVLYWTVSNLFSLTKNLVLWWLSERPHEGSGGRKAGGPVSTDQVRVEEGRWFLGASLGLTLLTGWALPSLFLVASTDPLPQAMEQLTRAALQMAGLFGVLPALLWAMSGPTARRWLAWGMTAAFLAALVSSFGFAPRVSFNASYTVNDPAALDGTGALGESLLVIFLGLGAVWLATSFRCHSWMTRLVAVAAMAVGALGVVSLVSGTPSRPTDTLPASPKAEADPIPLSRNAPNQVFFFIDGFTASLWPEVVRLEPELAQRFDGFVWYSNNVSYGDNTFVTTPALMGGEEFTPEALNARSSTPLATKHRESQWILPKVFQQNRERVVLIDHNYIEYDGELGTPTYGSLPGVTSLDLRGRYSAAYFEAHPLPPLAAAFLKDDYDLLARFSLLRSAPPAARSWIYDDGEWWVATPGPRLSGFVREGLPTLEQLSQMTVADEGPGTAFFFYSEVLHDGGAFDTHGSLTTASVSVPDDDLARYGNVYSARAVYDARAVMVRVALWLDRLKELGVYNRTRIAIVADHGHPLDPTHFGAYPRLRPLAMYKEYEAQGPVRTDDRLMTTADTPAFLTAGLPGAVTPPQKRLPLRSSVGPDHPGPNTQYGWPWSKTYELRANDARVPASWREVQP